MGTNAFKACEFADRDAPAGGGAAVGVGFELDSGGGHCFVFFFKNINQGVD